MTTADLHVRFPLGSGVEIGGLPLHPLVVHVVVVLLPLAALGLLACILRPAWSTRYGSLVLLGLLGSTVAAFVATWSGKALAATVGSPGQHQVWGERVPWVALVLLLLGGGWLVTVLRAARRPGEGGPRHTRSSIALEAGAAMAAVATIGLVVVTGHTGATATWAARVGSGASASAPSSSATDGAYTMAQVAEHATAASCWSAINGDVYDLTTWIGKHPGGANAIRSICGQDGSAGFNNRHATTPDALATLPRFKIGTLLR